jgi:glycosyltransferase involved in cell wall biosynthesis
MSRVLMVALEFPPCHGAGVQRTLSFVRHLPQLGWQPVVLTASTAAYRHVDESATQQWPQDVEVSRAWALDSSRHLAIGGRYLSFTASPDRYVTWFWPAVIRGLRLIRRHQPSVIWSTYPVATSHWIASVLSRRSGLPWVADYRDPAQFLYDQRVTGSRLARHVDAKTVEHASRLIFTTGRARDLYLERYGALTADRTGVIENGFDGAAFSGLVETARDSIERPNVDVLVLHSGALYGEGRDPAGLIRAAGILGDRLAANGRRLVLRFRGISSTDAQRELVRRLGAEPYVEFSPRISFREAQQEMLRADVLVLIQSELFDLQIPGKVYEYIAARRPIVALTGMSGATAELLHEVDAALIVGDQDVAGIVDGLDAAVAMGRRSGDLRRYDRAAGAGQLADILGSVAAGATQ